MSAKTAEDYCEAVEGQFAWFAQLCMKAATSTYCDEYGDEYGVCNEHAQTTTGSRTT